MGPGPYFCRANLGKSISNDVLKNVKKWSFFARKRPREYHRSIRHVLKPPWTKFQPIWSNLDPFQDHFSFSGHFFLRKKWGRETPGDPLPQANCGRSGALS